MTETKEMLCFALLWFSTTLGCAPASEQNHLPKQTPVFAQKAATAQTDINTTGDEQQFRQFLSRFKTAVKQNNKVLLMRMLNDPLQTNPQWSNNDLRNATINYRDGLLSRKELPAYLEDIFSKDVIRLVPKAAEDDLSVIDTHSNEDYYLQLRRLTDKGSTIFELQKQYMQDNGKETSFGFVFGKVKGTYKILSYYTPWPLKG